MKATDQTFRQRHKTQIMWKYVGISPTDITTDILPFVVEPRLHFHERWSPALIVNHRKFNFSGWLPNAIMKLKCTHVFPALKLQRNLRHHESNWLKMLLFESMIDICFYIAMTESNSKTYLSFTLNVELSFVDFRFGIIIHLV